MAAWLAMAAELVAAVPAPPAEAPRTWYALEAQAYGDVTSVTGRAGYDAEPLGVAVAISYRAWRGQAGTADISAVVGRTLDRRTRLDVQLWRGLTRGAGAGFTVTRTLGPDAH